MLKILFIANSQGIDYQCHCLFHGLHELNDVTIYTVNDQPYMYDDYPQYKRQSLYGRGFTLPCRIDKNRRHLLSLEDAQTKLSQKFFDVIIYGQIFRCQDLWETVSENYPSNKIFCIDGQDYTYDYSKYALIKKVYETKWVGGLIKKNKYDYKFSFLTDVPRFIEHYASDATFFKREISDRQTGKYIPIGFAIPKSLVIGDIPEKKRKTALIIPGKLDTYIYTKEEDYYHGYQESYWGVTCKKEGWDCLRHYEIMANGCIPYFKDIDACPDSTMVIFPKSIISYTNRLYHTDSNPRELMEVIKYLLHYTRQYLTTENLARYVLSFL